MILQVLLLELDTQSFGEKFFYGYDFNWYDSKDLIQAQKNYNNFASGLSIPQMEYRVKGLDINIRAGYDVIHKDQDNFLGGLGGKVGWGKASIFPLVIWTSLPKGGWPGFPKILKGFFSPRKLN